MQMIRLFNEPEGQQVPGRRWACPQALIDAAALLGISGAANIAVGDQDGEVVRVGRGRRGRHRADRLDGAVRHPPAELTAERGEFTARDAAVAYHQYLLGLSTDYVEELTYPARKRVHNLKYYTWVEQQGKTYDEIQAQWYQTDYWTGVHGQVDEIDALIEEFNAQGRAAVGWMTWLAAARLLTGDAQRRVSPLCCRRSMQLSSKWLEPW